VSARTQQHGTSGAAEITRKFETYALIPAPVTSAILFALVVPFDLLQLQLCDESVRFSFAYRIADGAIAKAQERCRFSPKISVKHQS
jgi:hypothetical protein